METREGCPWQAPQGSGGGRLGSLFGGRQVGYAGEGRVLVVFRGTRLGLEQINKKNIHQQS